MPLDEKTKFLIRNLAKGLIWLVLIVVVFLYLLSLVDDINYEGYLEQIYDRPFMVFLIFVSSEVIFGIIPPEIFMLLSAQHENILFYVVSIAIFATLSYLAGVIGYYIGRYLHDTAFFRFVNRNFLEKYIEKLKKFGGFLIIVAALTPLPFSAIAMLMGSVKYDRNQYLLYSLTRFLRYIVYSILIWHTNIFA